MDELIKDLPFELAMTSTNLSRRSFIKLGAATGVATQVALTLGFLCQDEALAQATGPTSWTPNAFLRISTDGTVTVIAKHLEMGQGSYTGLATLIAEELDVDWQRVKVVGAPANSKLYKNLFWGDSQGTGGSSAIANSWEQMRRAGATAKAMLIHAAAKSWQVAASEIQLVHGELSHPSGKRSDIAKMVSLAATLPVPETVTLKTPDQFRLIGKKISRRDSLDKTTGKAIFTQDFQVPGMLVALVAHAPRMGAKLKSFDAKAAKKIEGVTEVFAIPQGVAVVAKNFWSAKKARDALKIVWDEQTGLKINTTQLWKEYAALAQKPGAVALEKGDVKQARAKSTRVIESEFQFPFLAHAAMEPMNCVVKLTGSGAHLWYGAQLHTQDQASIATRLGCKLEDVVIETLYAGGSFGRRGSKDSDYVLEALEIAIKLGIEKPVKLIWTREDDMHAGYFRPMYLHKVSAGVDEQGKISFWQHRVVGQSLMKGSVFEKYAIKNGVDHTSVEGLDKMFYRIPVQQLDAHIYPLAVPVLWFRSVGHTHTAYVKEVMMDQLAKAAGIDPIEFRLQHTENNARQIAALKLVAEKSNWSSPLAAATEKVKRGRGVAVHMSFGTVVAHVAEVSVQADGRFTVDRVVSAVECGIAVNPDVVAAQVEGSVGMALAALKHQKITFKNGAVEQSNFHDYPMLRIAEMPKVDVHIVPSANPPSGIGEPAFPPAAPAIANALAAAMGKWPTHLPFDKVL